MEVHCVTSVRHKSSIETFLSIHRPQKLFIYFIDNRAMRLLSRLPFLGIYLHYYYWIWASRKKIRHLLGSPGFVHVHHVTYSSIKLGTPLYNLNIKTILGPLGGGEFPHRSLHKYLGRHLMGIRIKFRIGQMMAWMNPSVKWSIQSADKILTSNAQTKAFVARYAAIETTQMFDAGLSEYFVRPFRPKDLSGKIHILWIGRMLPRKGLTLAIEAINCLPRDFDFHFWILGDGPLKERLRLDVRKAGMESRVTFMDSVPHESIGDILMSSHLLLFPSIMDSCPMQVFEAFAFGLPVITLNHQGMKDQVDESRGIKVRVDDHINYPNELAQAIIRLVSSETMYQQISHNAYQFGQEQVWKGRIKSFLDSIYG